MARPALWVAALVNDPDFDAFWEVNTASHIDWPQQSRLAEIADNRDGTLSVIVTIVTPRRHPLPAAAWPARETLPPHAIAFQPAAPRVSGLASSRTGSRARLRDQA